MSRRERYAVIVKYRIPPEQIALVLKLFAEFGGTYLAGLGRISPKVIKTGDTISLLFQSDKFLSMMQKVGKLSSNSTISTLSSLLNSYDGILVGMQLSK